MTAIERHPQRAQIIDGIVSGKKLAEIAAGLQPPIHESSISRYRTRMLGSVAQRVQGRTETTRAIKQIYAAACDPTVSTELKEQIRSELQSSTAKLEERFERWITNAELPDSDGQLRHSALSLHSRNALTALEFRAKLAGILQEAANVSANVSVGVLVTGDALPGSDTAAGGVTIDLEPER